MVNPLNLKKTQHDLDVGKLYNNWSLAGFLGDFFSDAGAMSLFFLDFFEIGSKGQDPRPKQPLSQRTKI